MRLIVFFDLPMVKKKERREYVKFRKYLLKQGFIKNQFSVYSKITLNNTATEAVIRNLRSNLPEKGNIQVLTVSEKQFQNIQYMLGERQNEILDNVERLVIL